MAIYFVSADWIITSFSFNSEFWEHSLQQWVPGEQDTDLKKSWRDKDLHPSPDSLQECSCVLQFLPTQRGWMLES